MHIVSGTKIYEKKLDASIVTIGNFDGVHRGHAEIFAHLKQTSITRGIPSVVVTFEPHPLKILAPESAPSMITTFEQKVALIDDSGIDNLVVVPFTKEFSRLSASDFVLTILCAPLGMKHIIIGHDLHLHILGRDVDKRYVKNLERICEANNSWLFMEGLVLGKEKLKFFAEHKFGISGQRNEAFGIAVAEMVKSGAIVWVPNSGGQVEI